jgi:hypothetical protein
MGEAIARNGERYRLLGEPVLHRADRDPVLQLLNSCNS